MWNVEIFLTVKFCIKTDKSNFTNGHNPDSENQINLIFSPSTVLASIVIIVKFVFGYVLNWTCYSGLV